MEPDLVHEDAVHVRAGIERVHDSLTTLAGIRRWWSPVVTGHVGPGGDFHVGFEGLDETITITVIESKAATVKWLVREHSSAPDWAGSRVEFRLAPDAGGCRLEVRHEGVPADQVAAGWSHFLMSLRSLVERGEGLPYPLVAPDALSVAMSYHEAWTDRRFDDAIGFLAEGLATEVPINEYSSRAEWAEALVGFGNVVDRTDMVSAMGSDDQAVLIYDMHTQPYGVLRIAEHFTVADGLISRIRHVHDTAVLRAAAST